MNTISSRLTRIAALTGLTLGAFVLSAAASWTSAPPNPPSGNPSQPINVGEGGQIKDGYLTIKGLSSAGVTNTYGLIVENGNVGIGTLSPTSKLQVVGTTTVTGLVVSGGSPATGKVLTAVDNAGTVGWASAGSAGQSLYLGPITEYKNKMLVEAPAGSDTNCPSGSIVVGFNLYNMGENYSKYGSLFCRKVLLVNPDAVIPSGATVLPVTSTP